MSDISKTESTEPKSAIPEVPFGVNEMRLDGRQWLVSLFLFVALAVAIPQIWKRAERFDVGPDYRIPYSLSTDYWLYQKRLEKLTDRSQVPVLGDSVIWGEYVRKDGTLTHFLDKESGRTGEFINGGVNGAFPLALEGLTSSYCGALHDRKVILHYNMLWMSSPKADLSTPEEETFNHSALVPQLFTPIPCYRADATARLNAVAVRSIDLLGWVNHIDTVYFDQRSIPLWTLEQDSSDPPKSPNAWRNPIAQIHWSVPEEPDVDPQRGPTSARHRAWNGKGAEPTHFEWVGTQSSLQWKAFLRTVDTLRGRHCDVLVILGPFNESMVAPDQQPTYRELRDGIAASLRARRIAAIVPAVLPSNLYADASHPLTDGYALLAGRIYHDPEFQRWLTSR